MLQTLIEFYKSFPDSLLNGNPPIFNGVQP